MTSSRSTTRPAPPSPGCSTRAANPAPDAVNGAAAVARYTGNGAQLYDLLTATTAAIADAAPFVRGEKALYLDVCAAAPVGTPRLAQFENSSVATASNFPAGRHSRYRAATTVRDAWQRLTFLLDDRLDDATGDSAVNQIVLMANPNTYSADSYRFDNDAIYAAAQAATMHVGAAVNGTATAPKGAKYATASVRTAGGTVVDSLCVSAASHPSLASDAAACSAVCN